MTRDENIVAFRLTNLREEVGRVRRLAHPVGRTGQAEVVDMPEPFAHFGNVNEVAGLLPDHPNAVASEADLIDVFIAADIRQQDGIKFGVFRHQLIADFAGHRELLVICRRTPLMDFHRRGVDVARPALKDAIHTLGKITVDGAKNILRVSVKLDNISDWKISKYL